MKDTPQAVKDLYRTLLMDRPGVERLKMGCAMFDASRVLARANLKAHLHTDTDIRVRLFVRTYGRDFDPHTIAQIVERLSTRQRWADIHTREEDSCPPAAPPAAQTISPRRH
jgi:hypothetical protein